MTDSSMHIAGISLLVSHQWSEVDVFTLRCLYGIDLMNELARDYGLRGIAFSGYGMHEGLARRKNAGFIARLVKPVDVDRLNRVLEQAAPAA